MSKLILLAGALALLAAAGATTFAFRTTTPELAQPVATGPLAEHLRQMREEILLP
jgi:hypothetical protein